MKNLILKLALWLNRNELRIKSQYTVEISVLEHNHPQLKVGQEVASLEINTRISKVEINYSSLLEENKFKSYKDGDEYFYSTLYEWIKKFAMYIEVGDVSLRYLIDNSGKKVENPTYEEDGEKMIARLTGQKDYLVNSTIYDKEGESVKDEDGILLSYWAKLKVEVLKRHSHYGENESPYDYY